VREEEEEKGGNERKERERDVPGVEHVVVVGEVL
jgi:hypothetical protein